MAITPAALLRLLESFPWETWDASLGKAMSPPYRELVTVAAADAARAAGGELNPNDPLLSRFMTKYVLERATQINETTRALLSNTIRGAFEDPNLDQDTIQQVVREKMREQFEGYENWRADRIARSETAIAYNHANVLGFYNAGVQRVEVIDGTEDADCASANGQIWELQDALAEPIAHPNCTRVFVPIVPDDEQRAAPSERFSLEDEDLAFLCALAAEAIIARDDPHVARVLDLIED